ncbi:unnamed protein product [Trifolium pratense]|uniref:Uncharacterized protein n=2 Tax=Trifolium pratense TaxID=57577 RepID=A0ACB0J1A7_TRIPR|nr:unnamed protein product [Trifolium pratense]CAJ2638212.1 unnamed protein product [Trifolium pratense]
MNGDGSFVQPAIPRFDGHYDHWSMLMENFLRSKEYWELIEPGYDTSKDIWDAMKKKFEGNARVKRSHLQALRREFETLEMRSGEGVTEYFSRVMTVANKMRTYGEEMSDVKVVEKILRSLTEKFNYIVCSIEESKDIDALSIDELQSSLIVHEQKFQRRSGEEQALKVTYEGGIGRGRGAYLGRGRGRENKKANYAEIDEETEMLLMSYVELYEAKREDAWFLDSGCSNHMCGDRTVFNELDEKF